MILYALYATPFLIFLSESFDLDWVIPFTT